MLTLVTKSAGVAVLIATWNLNHRVGKTRFRAEAVNAVAALQADVVVLTEYYPGYYPRDYESIFRADLSKAGWHLRASEIVGEIANRVLIASRFALEPFPLRLPDFSFTDARYVTEADGFQLAGTAGAISDHAAVLARVQRR